MNACVHGRVHVCVHGLVHLCVCVSVCMAVCMSMCMVEGRPSSSWLDSVLHWGSGAIGDVSHRTTYLDATANLSVVFSLFYRKNEEGSSGDGHAHNHTYAHAHSHTRTRTLTHAHSWTYPHTLIH